MRWYLDYDDRKGMEHNIHICEVEAPNNRVCFMADAGEETEDKANLIAAAPDLRSALKDIIDHASGTLEMDDGEKGYAIHSDFIFAAEELLKKINI